MARKKVETTVATTEQEVVEKVTGTVEATATPLQEDKKSEKEVPMVEPINLKEQKKDYNRLIGLVKREYSKVEISSLNIAFALHQIYSQELYLHDGFKNISECGEEHFNLSKTTVNAFINVIEKFAKRDEKGNVLYGKEQAIIEEYEKFTWSKLCLLTSVPAEYLDEFYSSMTAKQIREKKAEISKRITANEESKIIEDAEAEENASTAVDAEESENADAEENGEIESGTRRGIIPMRSCCSVNELKEICSDDAYMFAMNLQFEKFCKEYGTDKFPHIEIMFTFAE